MQKSLIAWLLAAVMITCAACAKSVDQERERAEVVRVINTSIKWCFPDKSRERLYGSMLNDSTFFMFHPDSRSTIKGFDAFERFAEQVFMPDACQPKGSTIKELRVVFSGRGMSRGFRAFSTTGANGTAIPGSGRISAGRAFWRRSTGDGS